MGNNDLALTYPHKKALQRILLKIAFLSDLIGTRGTRSRNWLIEKGFERNKIFIPNNVFDFEDFPPQEGSVKRYDMIYVGVLSYYKRIDLLIDVLHKLSVEKELKDIRLAVVGDGNSKGKLQRRSSRLKMDDHIEFFPPGDASFVCNLLNQSKMFVLTSQGEGLPMAMIEAMSCGLPVVVFDHADISDVVRHGENGMLIRPGDLDGFSEAVKGLLQDRGFHKKLSRGALQIRAEYKDRFSVEGIRRVWEGVL
jgi:glycosyltransferase involved in cell wall biosynthesis